MIKAHIFAVHEAMAACGANNIVLFNGLTLVERIASDMFDNDFISCVDKTLDKVNEDLKTHSSLTVAQG